MNTKAFFILIASLLAALFGAAQEAIVVYEGATTRHFVEKHPGSKYVWEVYVDFSPDVEASPNDYEIIGSALEDQIQIKWLNTGFYYLKVTETDLNGCENLKVLPAKVISNKQTIGFLITSGRACFNSSGDNGFNLPLIISGDDGQALTIDHFPLVVEFMLNGNEYSQEISFNNQKLLIADDWFVVDPQTNFDAKVEITAARDVQNNVILPDESMKTHTRTILALPKIEFESLSAIAEHGSQVTYNVKMISGNPDNSVYSWSLNPESGATTDLSLITGSSATIVWDGPPGNYSLQAKVADGNGCEGETISRQIQIIEPSGFIVNAGRDTTIGACQPYQLHAMVEEQPGETYAYRWKPVADIDNPNISNPIFTPGATTTFVVTVTNSKGISVSDSVEVTVLDLVVNVGTDVYAQQNSIIMLDASSSIGIDLLYLWTTNDGTIISGETTPTPIVSGFGTYYVRVSTLLGCVSIDSVRVLQLAYAPVAAEDYDTTAYRTEVIVPVLDNDTDAQNSLNPSTLRITSAPLNGTAYVDYDNFTIHYRPDANFQGNDNFEYQICNTFDKCDRANVYVWVNNFTFLIPEAFSPNGDGINDYFEILGIEFYEGNSITIINRWGNKVYEAKNYGISTTPRFWDGKANTGFRVGNEELATGTYFYILNLGNGEKPIAGSIYLDR